MNTITIEVSNFERTNLSEYLILAIDIITEREISRILTRDKRTYSKTNIERVLNICKSMERVLKHRISEKPAISNQLFRKLFFSYMEGNGKMGSIAYTYKSKDKGNVFKECYDAICEYDSNYYIEVGLTGFLLWDCFVVLMADVFVMARKDRDYTCTVQSLAYICLCEVIEELKRLLKDDTKELFNKSDGLAKSVLAYMKVYHLSEYEITIDKSLLYANNIQDEEIVEYVQYRNWILNPSTIPTIEIADKVLSFYQRKMATTKMSKGLKAYAFENFMLITTIKNQLLKNQQIKK